jgi:hypothetical protein
MYNPESFYVELKPMLDDENSWTGELEVNIVTDKTNPMDRESMLHLMHLTNLVACCVSYMDENPQFLETMEHYMLDNSDEIEDIEDRIAKVEYTDSNVVKLSFGSKTKGNA